MDRGEELSGDTGDRHVRRLLVAHKGFSRRSYVEGVGDGADLGQQLAVSDAVVAGAGCEHVPARHAAQPCYRRPSSL